MAHFTIENLTFAYPEAGKNALQDVNLQIQEGEYLVLIGKSGSGKSTLLRHLKTALTPHGKRSGRVLFSGKPLEEAGLREQSAKIGYVMQDPDSQIVTDKVWHELAFGLESLGCDQRTMRLRVAEMASYFGIQDWFHRDVAELSGGQKQLLNLASIMAMQPEVLILDEPTSQLDPIAAADFLNTVRKINLELGTTVILSEHRLEEVFPAADRVAVLEEGRLMALDTPRGIGRRLRAEGSDMVAALPAPMRIFYGAEGGGECPLTVREGRSWLSREMEGRPVCRETPPAPLEEIPAADAAVVLKEVWFRYEKDAPDVLRGVNMQVPRGSLFAVVGGNGAGKSTMLKAICHICRPYRGKVLLEGRKVEKYRPDELFQGMLAMLPQDPKTLFVKKTVREELLEMLPGRGGEEREERVLKIAAELQVEDLLTQHPYDLSGGEQQRAALAKVLLLEPKILLLDEPTKGIDSFYKKTLAEILAGLKRKGVTILLVSHDIEFCAQYADAVAMFFDGGVVTANTPGRFFAENSFYTTAANRMSRHLFPYAVTAEDVIRRACESRGEGKERIRRGERQ